MARRAHNSGTTSGLSNHLHPATQTHGTKLDWGSGSSCILSGGRGSRIGQFQGAATWSPPEEAWCRSVAAGSRDGTISENFSGAHDAPRIILQEWMSPFEYYMIGYPEPTRILPAICIHVIINAH